MIMLKLIDIHKTFNPGTINEKVALNGVDLHLNEGDFVTVIGRKVRKTIACQSLAEEVRQPDQRPA